MCGGLIVWAERRAASLFVLTQYRNTGYKWELLIIETRTDWKVLCTSEIKVLRQHLRVSKEGVGRGGRGGEVRNEQKGELLLFVSSLWWWKVGLFGFGLRYRGAFQRSAVCLCSLCADPLQAFQRHSSLMRVSIRVSHTFVSPTEGGSETGRGQKKRIGEKSDEESEALEKL